MGNEVTVTLTGSERRNNTTAGNPSWVLLTSDGPFFTVEDASVNYEVENRATVGGVDRGDSWVGRRVVLELAGTGRFRRVRDWRLADG